MGFSKGLMTEMIVTNLQKGFNTINQDLLLKKMRAIGFSNDNIN